MEKKCWGNVTNSLFNTLQCTQVTLCACICKYVIYVYVNMYAHLNKIRFELKIEVESGKTNIKV